MSRPFSQVGPRVGAAVNRERQLNRVPKSRGGLAGPKSPNSNNARAMRPARGQPPRFVVARWTAKASQAAVRKASPECPEPAPANVARGEARFPSNPRTDPHTSARLRAVRPCRVYLRYDQGTAERVELQGSDHPQGRVPAHRLGHRYVYVGRTANGPAIAPAIIAAGHRRRARSQHGSGSSNDASCAGEQVKSWVESTRDRASQ